MKIPANNQVIFIKNVVAVAAYRSCRLWRSVKMSWVQWWRRTTSSGSRTSSPSSIAYTVFAERPLLSGTGGWVPGHCYSVPYMKIPANNQVMFIKNVVAVAAYRSCRLWRRVKMSWIHYLLCDPPLDPE